MAGAKVQRLRRQPGLEEGGTMLGRPLNWPVLLVLVLFLLPLSCTRIQKPATSAGDAPLPVEQLSSFDAVPSEWGDLVSVSAPAGWGDAVLLWFQDEDGTVRVVLYNATTAQLARDARVIRRS